MKRRIYDDELYAHFVTYSCYKRHRLLDHDRCKRVVLGTLGSQLIPANGICIGFVIMPDHVHTLVWFSKPKQWKHQSSVHSKNVIRDELKGYLKRINLEDPAWQPRYYPFIFIQRRN